jgi:hypothetical protein
MSLPESCTPPTQTEPTIVIPLMVDLLSSTIVGPQQLSRAKPGNDSATGESFAGEDRLPMSDGSRAFIEVFRAMHHSKEDPASAQ